MAYKWKTLEAGIRTREHASRKHGIKADVYFTLRFYVDGKRIEEALGWATQGWTLAKARAELARLKEAQRTGQGETTLAEKRAKAQELREAEQEKPTLAHLWDIYNADPDHRGRAVYLTDRANMKHVLPSIGQRTPDRIRTAHIDAIRNELLELGKSPQTIKHVLSLVRRIIRYGAKKGLCSIPDISKLHYALPELDNQKTECLTPEQAKALLLALDADPDQNLAAMMRLAMTTGMRRGALFGLQWQDLDFQKGHITLRGEEAKSGKTTTIPMTQAARAVLESITPQGSNYLFPSPVHGGKRTECRVFLKRIKEAANLPADFRPLHGLRHTYASWLASSGKVDLFTLQRLMTHGSPAMTQRYAHLADEAVKKAASVIDDCMDIAVNATPPEPPQQEEAQAKVLHFGRGKGKKSL